MYKMRMYAHIVIKIHNFCQIIIIFYKASVASKNLFVRACSHCTFRLVYRDDLNNKKFLSKREGFEKRPPNVPVVPVPAPFELLTNAVGAASKYLYSIHYHTYFLNPVKF